MRRKKGLRWGAVVVLTGLGCSQQTVGADYQAAEAVAGECYVVGDQTNLLAVVDRGDTNANTNETTVGTTVGDIESIAVDPVTKVLFAANGGRLGRLNVNNAAFAPAAQPFGVASGSDGDVGLTDVDGLAFDPCSGLLYGAHRRGTEDDVLFIANPRTGAHVVDSFGPGASYVVIEATAGLGDIDDIAVDPVDCRLYAIANDGGAGDRLVEIRKADGAVTDIGATGVADIEGLSFDPSGQLWGTSGGAGADPTGLYPIEKTTGAANAGAVRLLDNSSDYEALDCMIANDSDGDGICDLGEGVLGSDPNDADTDDDGIRDGDEPGLADDDDNDGLPGVLDPDSDNDGVADGTEIGLTMPDPDTDVTAGNFTPDTDGETTDPLNPDTDGGSVEDGAEDANSNGGVDGAETDPNDGGDDVPGTDSDDDGLTDDQENDIGSNPNDADTDDDGVIDGDEANAGFDTDRDGLINVLDPDSDDDGLLDGTESGITMPHADTDVSRGHFVADADPGSTTFPLVGDSDRGSVRDGTEDTNKDGEVDTGEIDPENPHDDVPGLTDTDGDGLSDAEEELLGSDPNDADTDDDGVIDGKESNPWLDTDGDLVINVLDPDSDDDGLTDGTEVSITMPHPDTDVSAGQFVADEDPTTRTGPLNPDTDAGSVRDGTEDLNKDGRIDSGEGDPLDPSDDVPAGADDDEDGLTDAEEDAIGSNPSDADTDDDGVLDGDEANYSLDTDGDGLINVLDPDSDNDGIKDGTEVSITQPHPDTDEGAGHFIADVDPGSRTSALLVDTDRGGVADGQEDTNKDGLVDSDELDPRNPVDDMPDGDADGDGIPNGEDNCLFTPNDNQTDADSDGFGDACDNTLGLSGGGCSATGSEPGTGALIFLTMLLVGFGLRRRSGALVAIALVAISAGSVEAQQITGDIEYSVERLEIASDRLGILDIESASVAEHMVIDLGLWMGYANDPLVAYTQSGDDRNRTAGIVADRLGGALVGSVALYERFAITAALPLVLYQGDDLGAVMTQNSLSTTAIGDFKIAPKVQLLAQRKYAVDLGLMLGLTLPTASADTYVGDSGVTFSPTVLLGRRFTDTIRGGASLAYFARTEKTSLDLDVDDEVSARVGVALDVGPAEVSGALRLATAANDIGGSFNRNHAELLAGVDVPLPSRFVAFGAVGVGLAEAFATPDFRALLGVRVGLGDGKADRLLAGARDTDGDGIFDEDDDCVDDPEDVDSFKDTDGCPDPDNDGDTVLDVDDNCINVAGVVAMAGCPDPDRDNDTVADRIDNCPDEPGEVEYQGCTTRQSVRLTGGGLDILDIVHFRTDKAIIQSKSYGLLDNVAAVLVAHSELTLIRIEGHTDARGDDAYNLGLSQRRADSVRRYLIKKGVEESRLEAKGYGETKPVSDNETQDGRSANRRVTFTLIGASNIIQQESGPTEDTAGD